MPWKRRPGLVGWRGHARHRGVRIGEAGAAAGGLAVLGLAWPGRDLAGEVAQGSARFGPDRQAGRGAVRTGGAGSARHAWKSVACIVEAWPAGRTGQRTSGRGSAGVDDFGRSRRCTERKDPTWQARPPVVRIGMVGRRGRSARRRIPLRCGLRVKARWMQPRSDARPAY